MDNLKIQDFGPIADIDIRFGDLTFFIGPQASGKSIALETVKLAKDRDSIVSTLDRHNYIIGHDPKRILNVYFGEGMEKIWTSDTSISVDGERLTLHSLAQPVSDKESSIFYIPAQRIVCMGDGYPKYFSDFSFTTPFVLREFTETLRTFLQLGLGNKKRIFPVKDDLRDFQKKAFDSSIFHQGEIVMDEVSGQKKMMLSVDGMTIPFMAWSAGQKEFMPLLLGFYCLASPPEQSGRRKRFETVVIEEPEMGLHPKAIVSILLQVCELMQSGYKVIVSTHSSLMLEYAWAFNTLKGHSRDFHKAMCDLFKVTTGSAVGKMLKGIQEKSVRTYFFSRTDPAGKVKSKDITSLDVMSEQQELSEWGGIAEFSAHVNNIISKHLL